MDLDRFQNQLRVVLNHLSDIAFLENHNLVNAFLTEEENRQPNRVQLLRGKISAAIKILVPPEETPATAAEWRSSRILTMRYMNGMELFRIEEELGLSQRQVQRELKKAIDALASILWDQLHEGQSAAVEPGEDEPVLNEASDLEVLKKELKSWEINFSFSNLRQMVEQAIHLCEFLSNSDLNQRVRYQDIDPDLLIMVDPILTKQGLYKILSTVVTLDQTATIEMHLRQLNEHFIELSIQIDHAEPLDPANWQVANLFFTVQGFNEAFDEQPRRTILTIHLPLMNQGKCLVVDDVASVRMLIERMLAPYGIQVFGVDHPQEALNLAQLMVPNFILLDILMPKMDGWELIKKFKLNPETKSIPVIICSALYEPDLARAVGAAGYIRKPIDRLDLIRTLQEAGLIAASFQNTSQ